MHYNSKSFFLLREVCNANYRGIVSSVQKEMYHTQLEIQALLLLTFYVLNFPEGTKTSIYILCNFSALTWQKQLKFFLK